VFIGVHSWLNLGCGGAALGHRGISPVSPLTGAFTRRCLDRVGLSHSQLLPRWRCEPGLAL